MPEGSIQRNLANEAIIATDGLEQPCPAEPQNGFKQMVCTESGLSARETRAAVDSTMNAHDAPAPWKEDANGIQMRDYAVEEGTMRFSIFDGGDFVLLYIFR